MAGVIFDLDQTLIDTSIADGLRKQQRWSQVYGLIPRFTIYPGVIESISFLHHHHIPVSIVTSSPSTYCNRVLQHWGINIQHKVCYHDTTLRKPHPQPILKALSLMCCDPGMTLSLGDRDIDIQASNTANVISIGCQWGSSNLDLLAQANPHHTLSSSSDLLPFFQKFFER